MLNVLLHIYLGTLPVAFIGCFVYSGYEVAMGVPTKDRFFDWANDQRANEARGLSLFTTLLGTGLWPLIVFLYGPYNLGKNIGNKIVAKRVKAEEHKKILEQPIEKLLSA